MLVQYDFDLPYNLRVDGNFELNFDGRKVNVVLRSVYRNNPTMKGASYIENVAIVDDETDQISYTKVRVVDRIEHELTKDDFPAFLDSSWGFVIRITNKLVSALRIAYGEFVLGYVTSKSKLSTVEILVTLDSGNQMVGGLDSFGGGITFQQPPRIGDTADAFAKALANGANLSPASELYFDARRYLKRGQLRMALVNLAISFEVGLANNLSMIAAARGDNKLESEIEKASLAELGTGLAKRLLSQSFTKRSFWGDRFSDTFEWLRIARNGVLHKAQMHLTSGANTRDFNDEEELSRLFQERDWLVVEIEKAALSVVNK